MKWIIIVVLLLAFFAGGLSIGYEIGFRSRPPLSPRDILLVQISFDASNYNALKAGKIDLVEETLQTLLWGEIKSYDLYKKEDPTYNTSNDSLKLWVEKGRVIAQEKEMQMITPTTDTK